ncbi:hypothetical protein BS162P3_00041 [Bacteroides phage BS162P3]|nr:hypothetical protein BS162P3_00041 [Bacteroides phage BS162P3]
MKAKKLVGKWVVVDLTGTNLHKSGSVAFKVVGYNADMDWVMVDAGSWGWDNLDPDDIVIEKCKNYWYIFSEDITKVL